MKKFLWILFVLIILSGVIFLLGWVQLYFGPGERALLFSKTNGWEKTIIQAGTFQWRWQKLLPTNMKIYSFDHLPRSFNYEYRKDLPGASEYTSFYDIQSLSTQYTLSFEYELTDQGYTSLIPSYVSILENEESQDDFWNSVHETFRHHLIQLVDNYTGSSQIPNFNDLKEYIESNEPRIHIVFGAISQLKTPDFDLYTLIRDQHATYIQEITTTKTEAEKIAVYSLILDKSRVQLLEEYGKILQSFPDILDYFRLISETGFDPLNIQADLQDLRRLGGL